MNKHKIPLEKIVLQDGGVHLVVNAKVNRKKIRLVLDTGASRTVMDKNRIDRWHDGSEVQEIEQKSAGLGTDSMESSITTIEHLKIEDFKVKSFPVILLDLSHVNSSYQQLGVKAVDGILGGELLELYHANIDYKKSIMTLKGKKK
ncbi:MAG: retropepsin-like aspartic protease [Flavobacteriales bacterium]